MPLLVLGIGQGVAIILLTQLGMADVPDEHAGAGSGLVNTAHQLGGSVGLAILASVFVAVSGHHPGVVGQVAGFETVFRVADGFYALAILVSVVMLVATRGARRADPAPATAATAVITD